MLRVASGISPRPATARATGCLGRLPPGSPHENDHIEGPEVGRQAAERTIRGDHRQARLRGQQHVGLRGPAPAAGFAGASWTDTASVEIVPIDLVGPRSALGNAGTKRRRFATGARGVIRLATSVRPPRNVPRRRTKRERVGQDGRDEGRRAPRPCSNAAAASAIVGPIGHVGGDSREPADQVAGTAAVTGAERRFCGRHVGPRRVSETGREGRARGPSRARPDRRGEQLVELVRGSARTASSPWCLAGSASG